MIAQGATGQTANLQEWQKSCGSVLSIVNKCGWIGVGTASPSTTLDVNGNIISSKLTLNQTVLGATTLRVDGSISTKVLSKSTAYTMGVTDFAVLANASTGAFTVTLPQASTATGMIVLIKKTDSSGNAVTVEGYGSGSNQDKIEGKTSIPLSTQYSSLLLFSNGSASPNGVWFILSNAT